YVAGVLVHFRAHVRELVPGLPDRDVVFARLLALPTSLEPEAVEQGAQLGTSAAFVQRYSCRAPGGRLAGRGFANLHDQVGPLLARARNPEDLPAPAERNRAEEHKTCPHDAARTTAS